MEKDSVIPAKANIIYHIISIKWYQKWQSYINSNGSHPGLINTREDLDSILDAPNMDRMVVWPERKDTASNLRIKNGCKEDVHYKILCHQAWKVLNKRFGTALMYKVGKG